MIKDLLLHNLIFLILATLITIASSLLESAFLLNYLKDNIVTILVAFLGVSVATISIVSTKLKEVIDKYNGDFTTTVKSLRFSIKEQLFYISFAVILSVLFNSPVIMGLHGQSKEAMELLFVHIFIASLYNLYDTANAIFIIFEWESEIR